MKKYFLLIFMLAGTFLFAQVNKKVNPKFLKAVAPANYNNREAKSGLKLTQGPLKAHARSQSTCGTIFTSGPNVFGVGGTLSTVRQNCLSYNADLNTVLWTQ